MAWSAAWCRTARCSTRPAGTSRIWAVLARPPRGGTVYLTAATPPPARRRRGPRGAEPGARSWCRSSPPTSSGSPSSRPACGPGAVGARSWPGCLLGLAVAARTYPLLVLLALVLLGLRAGRLASVWRALGGAAAGIGVVLLPFLVANPGGDPAPVAAWWRAEAAGLGSMWIIPQLLGHALPSAAVTALGLAGLVAAVLAGAAFALGSARRPTVAEVALVVVAIALVTGKSLPRAGGPVAGPAGRPVRRPLARPPGLGRGRGPALRAMVWVYVGGLSQARPRPAPRLVRGVRGPARRRRPLPGLAGLAHPAALRPGARAAGGVGPARSPTPDSDAVVDELAGPFTDAPDRLIVRLG